MDNTYENINKKRERCVTPERENRSLKEAAKCLAPKRSRHNDVEVEDAEYKVYMSYIRYIRKLSFDSIKNIN
jgi:hypothetical protein